MLCKISFLKQMLCSLSIRNIAWWQNLSRKGDVEMARLKETLKAFTARLSFSSHAISSKLLSFLSLLSIVCLSRSTHPIVFWCPGELYLHSFEYLVHISLILELLSSGPLSLSMHSGVPCFLGIKFLIARAVWLAYLFSKIHASTTCCSGRCKPGCICTYYPTLLDGPWCLLPKAR